MNSMSVYAHLLYPVNSLMLTQKLDATLCKPAYRTSLGEKLSPNPRNLTKLLELARLGEASEQQKREIEKRSDTVSDGVLALRHQECGNQQARQPVFLPGSLHLRPKACKDECFNCGGPFPHQGAQHMVFHVATVANKIISQKCASPTQDKV